MSQRKGFKDSKLVRRLSFSPKQLNRNTEDNDNSKTNDKKRRPAPSKSGSRLKRTSKKGLSATVTNEDRDYQTKEIPKEIPIETPKEIPKELPQNPPDKPLSRSLTTQNLPQRQLKDTKALWKPIQAFATAIQNFEPNGKYQVRLQLGDKIKIQEQNIHWYKGIILTTKKKGIFPKNFVKLSKKLYDCEDDAMKELQVALWEWVGLLKIYFQDRKNKEFNKMQARVLQLMDWYSQIKSPETDENVKVQLMSRVYEKIEEGKRTMGLDVIVRRPDGTRCSEQNTGIIDLYHKYENLSNENTQQDKQKKKEQDHNSIFLLELKLFACSVGEPAEAIFCVWNKVTNSFITENFYVTLTAQGMPKDEDRIGNIKCVFKDISTVDIPNLYIFVKLVRIGKLDKKGKAVYRIPFGGALLPLSEISRKETEEALPVFTPNIETNFYNLPELILKNKDVSIVPKAKGVIVSVTHLFGTIENQLEKGNTPKHIGNLRDYVPTEKYGFPDIVYPGSSRNDFFLTLDSGEFSIDKTIEIEVSVKMNTGDILPDCIRVGASESLVSSFKSTIFYHTGAPRWNECISLLIPPSLYENCHLFFIVRICSANSVKEHGLGHLVLNKTDGTIIDDGSKNIQLYRLPKQNDDPLIYLNDPSKLLYRKGECIHVTTLLCSTALTQNSNVLSLLKWNTDTSKLPEVLNRFTFGSQFEIIKFMQETFDAMCQILDAKLDNIDHLVYDAIVFIIGILVDEKTSRFTNFAPVLDTYISKHFNSKTAHKMVISCFLKYLDNIETQAKNVLASLKAFTYLLKIIKRSLHLANSNDYIYSKDTELKSSLQKVFNSLTTLMSKKSPILIGAQAALLKNLSSWFLELENIFSKEEIAHIIKKLICADTRTGSEAKNKINIGKLEVFSSIIDNPLFLDINARKILIPLIVQHLGVLMVRNNIGEVSSCITVHSKILNFMHENREIIKELIGSIISLLPPLAKAFETIKNNDVSLLGVTCVLNTYFIIPPIHFAKLIQRMNKDKAIEFLSQQCQMMFVWCRAKTYPENWFSLKMFQMSIVKKMLFFISEALKKISENNNNWTNEIRDLWLNFFQAGFSFLDCTVLKLELFTAPKQTLIRENYKDMRLGVCGLLKKLWNDIGDKQNLLSNELVKEFLLVAMIEQRDLRNLGINLYFSALEKEFRTSKNFKTIESQTIDAFSAFLSPQSITSLNSVNFNEFFFQSLEKKLVTIPDIAPDIRKFLGDLKELCQHLAALSTLRDGDHDDDRTIATLRLMEYLKQSQRLNAYVKYIHNLVEHMTKLKNYNKAGMILLLHCDLLNWEYIQVQSRAPGGSRTESQFDLKTRLYLQIIDLFEQGLYYEKAISLLQELIIEIRDKECNYSLVSTYLEKEAELYRKMIIADRYPCEYFRVAYYGNGFASNLRDKEFIYCGNPLERIGEFTERIQSKFPDSQLMKTTEKPPKEILNSQGMYIQLFAVKPFPDDLDSSFKSHPNLPAKLREYRMSMINVKRFLYKKPFSKDKAIRKENEFKDLWTMDILYTTKDIFPVITDRSEIIETITKEVTPIENAVQTINSKNVELSKLAEQYKNSKENASPFTMVLSGTIDAAVSGGIENYKKAFLGPDYIRDYPQHRIFINELCDAFTYQLQVLSECIIVHASICPDSMQQLQDHLEEKLKELQETWSGDQKKKQEEADKEPEDKEKEKEQRLELRKSQTVVEEGGWGRAPSSTERPIQTSQRRGTIIGFSRPEFT